MARGGGGNAPPVPLPLNAPLPEFVLASLAYHTVM